MPWYALPALPRMTATASQTKQKYARFGVGQQAILGVQQRLRFLGEGARGLAQGFHALRDLGRQLVDAGLALVRRLH